MRETYLGLVKVVGNGTDEEVGVEVDARPVGEADEELGDDTDAGGG